MARRYRPDQAFDIAGRFLERQRAVDGPAWTDVSVWRGPSSNLSVFWWSGHTPLVEVPLVNTRSQSPSGYLLLSLSKELPPVLEYALEGPTLTMLLERVLRPALAQAEIEARPERYVFISSTEIYAEFKLPKDGGYTLVNVPGLFSIRIAKPLRLPAMRSPTFKKDILESQWETLTPNPPGDQPEVVLTNAVPVRYQQNCDAYASYANCRLNLKTPSSYCAPNRIVGCVPVAWAMLLAAWKKTGYWDSGQIWNNSNCWNIEWPSWGPWANPSMCSEVESTLWQLHGLCATDANGGTENGKTLLGQAIFRQRFGIDWRFAGPHNRPFELAASVISAGQPLLWTANGIWNPLKQKLSSTPVPGGVGHAVVAYGYKKANRTLLVALGWGDSYPNKWINYDQYRITRCIYLRKRLP